jgi:hypothetical protein
LNYFTFPIASVKNVTSNAGSSLHSLQVTKTVQIAGNTAVITDGSETFLFRVTFKTLNVLKKMCMSYCRVVIYGLN